MSTGSIHDIIKACRLKKGLSQSALAEKASINLRTLQRIENGQTVPRGHTLHSIASALEMPLEHFTTTDEQTPGTENRKFLQLLTLSCLSFWIFPFANIFIPSILLYFKRDSGSDIDAFGAPLIAFQKKWSLVTYGVLAFALLLAVIRPKAMDPLLPSYLIIAVVISCVVNSLLLILKMLQIRQGKNPPGMLAFAFVLVATVICRSEVILAQAANAPLEVQYGPVGKMVDLGGWSLHIYGQGLSNRTGPAVIFENGIRGFSFDWIPIQQKIASFAKSYSYDRAGYAWSNLGPRPYTMRQTVYNLHALLQKSGVPPPYVIVGASHGGLLARLFAREFPGEVVGMILVDAGYENGIQYINGRMLRPATEATGKPVPAIKTSATAEDNNLARTPAAVKAIGDALNKMGYPFTRVEAPFDKLPDSIQKLRLWAISQYEFYVANDNPFIFEEKAAMIKEREKQPYMLGDIPLIVLTAGSGRPDTDAEEKERRLNQTAMTNLSRNSKQIIVESGHHIHIEQPELVVDAIKQVIEAINKNGKLEE